RILHDVVDAIASAHARGIIHRDIKPGNILVLGSHALVTDFGVAKALSASLPLVGTTTAGMAIGTPAYMAPEQLAGDPAADHRLDIYAVGLLAYELLTGESPFTGSSPQAIMAAQLTRIPEPLHVLRPDVPPELSAIIMRSLAKSPEERPASAQDLMNELDAVTTPQGGVFGTAPVSASAPRAPAASSRRRRTVLIAALAIAGVAALAIATVPGRERDPDPEPGDREVDGAMDTVERVAPSAPLAAAARDTVSATGTAPARSRVALSRADSLAIAEAIRRESANKGPAAAAAAEVAAITAESLQVYVQRVLTDSLRTALESLKTQLRTSERTREAGAGASDTRVFDPRGFDPRSLERWTVVTPVLPPPASTRLRVVVADLRNVTHREDLEQLGRVITDSLRRGLARHEAFEVVDAKTTREATSPGANRLALGWALRGDLVVSGVYVLRNDSLLIQTQITDVRRGRVARAFSSRPAPLQAPLSTLDPLIERTAAEVSRQQAASSRMVRLAPRPRPSRAPSRPADPAPPR
ncbi:MAG: protein kinase domain-containing protein, partial [Gemmatimonadaceae bacterium]